MCGLHAYIKRKDRSTGATYFHGGQLLPEDSNVNPIYSLCVTIKFIDTYVNTLYNNIEWRCFYYQGNTKEILKISHKRGKTQLLKISRENVKLCLLILVVDGYLIT